MKGLAKVLVGISAFLMMSGGLMALTGWAMGAETHLELAWDRNGWDVSTEDELAYVVVTDTGMASCVVQEQVDGWLNAQGLSPFQNVDIDVTMTDVAFVQADDYGIQLEWNNTVLEPDYEVLDGTLYVRMPQYWEDAGLNGLVESGQVTVYLPQEAALEEVWLHTSMGDIAVEGLTVERLNVNHSMGEANLAGLMVESMTLENSMGDLTVTSSIVTQEIYAENSMADITIEGDLTGNITLYNSMGAIALRTSAPVTDFSYDLATSMGEVSVDGRGYGENVFREGGIYLINVDNNMGDIELTFGK